MQSYWEKENLKDLCSKCEATRSCAILRLIFAHKEVPIWPLYINRDIEQLKHERAALQDYALDRDELDLIVKTIDCKEKFLERQLYVIRRDMNQEEFCMSTDLWGLYLMGYTDRWKQFESVLNELKQAMDALALYRKNKSIKEDEQESGPESKKRKTEKSTQDER